MKNTHWTLALLTTACSGSPVPIADAGSTLVGGTNPSDIVGGAATGGSTNSGGAATDGGGTFAATGGAGGQSSTPTTLASCSADACPAGQVCFDNVLIQNFGPTTETFSCQPNPCGTAALDCSCAKNLCSPPSICQATSYLRCTYQAVCASPNTPIATPQGERAIESLQVGDLVYSVVSDSIRAVRVVRTAKRLAINHHVFRVTLSNGRWLEISGPHPTADGRAFAELKPGDALDGQSIDSIEVVDYAHQYTYDILPDSDTGQYFAAGALIGSTLTPVPSYFSRSRSR